MRFLSQAARQFFTPETLTPFLLASIVLSVLDNAVYQLLTNLCGTSTEAILAIIGGGVLLLLGSLFAFAWSLRRFTFAAPLPNSRPPARRKGLIFMVSKPETCRKAIDYHQGALTHCWLLHSDESYETAKKIKQEYPTLQFELIRVANVNDPVEFWRLVRGVYHHLPAVLTSDEVIADYVGMTAHGSVGMVLACIGRDRPLQYTPGKFDRSLNAICPLDPIELDLRPVLGSTRKGGRASAPHAGQ